MKRLVIASHNEGKVREIGVLLKPLEVSVISAAQLELPEPEETGASFAENADIKSIAAAKTSGEYALSDDSGLCVPALDGAPGIYSARWAGKTKDFSIAMQRIYTELKDKGLEPVGQKAYFICVLSLASPQGKAEVFEGRVDGTLVFPPRGQNGFGYDPVFLPEGYVQTFGEMAADAKHAISHRARAFEKFIHYIRGKAL